MAISTLAQDLLRLFVNRFPVHLETFLELTMMILAATVWHNITMAV